MNRTITRSYDTYEDAAGVVSRLKDAGVADEDMSVVGRRDEADDSNAGEGASIGAGIGGAAGLLAGLGMIAIPGIGPVVAAGWLAATAAGAAAGAAAGGLVGAMTSSGMSEDDAHYYAETVRRGATVVSVQASDDQVPTVESIMDGATPIDPVARREEYRREGWTRFDESADPYKYPGV
ncbi:general stress protein [Bosea lathyri]|jgi:hypothetical protein|uniref:Heat induced stress protein YflT n=1 Tax=Bosea lathyri TaxID=1036778 RepID=A0A1H5XF52_9HYPH|nr:general stress protein [Bosea lathyri]SEG10263.1 hypothetical protein SAMN04488115_103217 [Bosea lathyri]